MLGSAPAPGAGVPPTPVAAPAAIRGLNKGPISKKAKITMVKLMGKRTQLLYRMSSFYVVMMLKTTRSITL